MRSLKCKIIFFLVCLISLIKPDHLLAQLSFRLPILKQLNPVLTWSQPGIFPNEFYTSVEPIGDVNNDGTSDVAVAGNLVTSSAVIPNITYIISGVDGSILGFSNLVFQGLAEITAVDDLNADGVKEILHKTNDIYLLDGRTLNPLFFYPVGTDILDVSVVPDHNGDGVKDIVFVTKNGLIVLLDGSNLLFLKNYQIPSNPLYSKVSISYINNAQGVNPAIIVGTFEGIPSTFIGKTLALSGFTPGSNLSLLWEKAGEFGSTVLNFGNDVLDASDFKKLYRLDGAGNIKWTFNPYSYNPPGFVTYGFAGCVGKANDLTGDGKSDVIVGSYALNKVYMLDGETGIAVWEKDLPLDSNYKAQDFFTDKDFNSDGKSDVILFNRTTKHLIVLNGKTGQTLLDFAVPGSSNVNTAVAFRIFNADTDPRLEAVGVPFFPAATGNKWRIDF